MIQDIILIAGVSALGISSYYIWLTKKYSNLFQKAQSASQMFNIGYLQSTQQLPINKHILLAGKAHHPENKIKIIQLDTKSTPHLIISKTSFKYSLFTKNKQQLTIFSQPQTLFFNLKQFDDKKGFGLSHDTNVAMIGKRMSNNRFEPLILMGQNKQSLLKAIDERIVRNRKISTILTVVGSLTVVGHAIHKYYSSKQLPK